MKNKVAAFIRSYQMILPGEHVICALSGGKDSMVLLSVLAELQSELRFRLSAAHFNHHLRGEEAMRDQAFAAEWCRAHQIPFSVGEADVAAWAQQQQLGIEEAARLLRYDYLLQLDPEAKIATAHTADDNLETLLMHMLRGCGLHGLTGIPPVRDRIIRPLLCADSSEILSYLQAHGIPHIEDSSNASELPLRNRIRHDLVPLFKRESPDIACRLQEMCQRLSEDDAFLAAQTDTAYNIVCRDGQLEISALLALPDALQRRVLQRYLRDVPALSARHLEAVLQVCSGSCPSARLDLPGNYRLQRSYGSLRLCSGEIMHEIPAEVRLFPDTVVSFGSWRISLRSALPAEADRTLFRAVRTDAAGAYTVRTKQPGDRIHLPGGTKKISRVMIDRKIPAEHRAALPLLCRGTEVVGLLPDLLSDHIIPQSGEPCWYLRTEIMEVSN